MQLAPGEGTALLVLLIPIFLQINFCIVYFSPWHMEIKTYRSNRRHIISKPSPMGYVRTNEKYVVLHETAPDFAQSKK